MILGSTSLQQVLIFQKHWTWLSMNGTRILDEEFSGQRRLVSLLFTWVWAASWLFEGLSTPEEELFLTKMKRIGILFVSLIWFLQLQINNILIRYKNTCRFLILPRQFHNFNLKFFSWTSNCWKDTIDKWNYIRALCSLIMKYEIF